MKYELSHDILARKVYEKSSQEDKMLRKIEAFITERYAYFLAQDVMLVKKDLEYVTPYLEQVNISEEERAFIEDSQKKVRRSEGRKVIMTLSLFVVPVLIGLSAWAMYQTYKTNKALEDVKIQKLIAEENEIKAKEAEKEAIYQSEKAIENAELAKQQELLAKEQEKIAKKQAQIVQRQALQLSKEADRARKAANLAERERQKAEREAQRAEEASIRAEREAVLAQQNEQKAIVAQQEAEEQRELALLARERADKAALEAKKAEEIAKLRAKEARALYLASLADNALRLRKGIIAYNLAKLSWNLDENLVAQKVLFDCQNAYLTDKSIFEEYEELSFQTYKAQTAIKFDQDQQSKNIDAWAKNVRDQVDLGSFYKAEFSNDKKLLALVLLNKVFIRDTDKNTKIATIPLKTKTKSVSFSSDDKSILIVLENNIVGLYNVKGELIKQLKHDSPITTASFSPKGKTYITTVSEDFEGKLWNERGDLLKTFKIYNVNSQTYPFNDGQSIIRLSKNNQPELVNLFTNESSAFDVLKNKKDVIIKISLSPDGNYVLTHTSENITQLWSSNGQMIRRIAPKEHPEDAIFSPNGNEIITSSAIDRKAKLWSLRGEQLAEFNYDGFDEITSVEFSDDQMRVLVCRSKIANLWGKKGRLLYTFSPKKPIISSSFSADNQSILIATKDGNLQNWNIVTPEEIIRYYDDAIAIRELTAREKSEYEIVPSDYTN